jgi:hypothetical protein
MKSHPGQFQLTGNAGEVASEEFPALTKGLAGAPALRDPISSCPAGKNPQNPEREGQATPARTILCNDNGKLTIGSTCS